MGITMNKQEEMTQLLEILEEIRPGGRGGRHHHGRPHDKSESRSCHKEKGMRRHHNEEGIREHCGGKEEMKIHPSAKKLLCILLREKKMNQRNIANIMNITAQAVSEIIKKMEQREYIIKENGEINNENIISLTDKGVEVAQKIENENKEYAEKLFKDFSDEELKILHDLMGKVRINRRIIENRPE